MIEKGETTKYIKYAIGEIMLVVIGILIALQINNWNKNKIQQENLYRQLYSISLDLEKDINLMENDLLKYRRNVDYFKLVQNKAYSDVDPKIFLKKLTYNVTLRNFGAIYSGFKAQGALEQLPDDMVKSLITHYEISLQSLYNEAAFHRTFVSDHVQSFILKNYKFEPGFMVDSVMGYEIMKDKKLYSYINYQVDEYENYSEMIETSILESKTLRNEIDAYLKNKNEGQQNL